MQRGPAASNPLHRRSQRVIVPSSRPSVRVSEILLGWLLSSLVLLGLKWRMLGDTYYWDEQACYFAQVFELATRLKAFLASHPPYVRSPLLTSLLALLYRYVSDARALQHGASLVVSALALPATFALTCELGGSRRTGWLAAILCGLVPAYFAQAGMVQMDLPATGLVTLAFVCALRQNWLGYAVLGSMAVLVKESAYWVCLASSLFVYLRLWRIDRRPLLTVSTLLRLWWTVIPGVSLFLWLLVHRHITGALISSDHTSVLSVGGIWTSFLHNVLEGRRLALSLCALGYVTVLYRNRLGTDASERAHTERLAVGATLMLWLSLPLCFPGQLVRYMLPALPAQCALAALGIAVLPQRLRLGTATLLSLLLVSGWRGDSLHANSPCEIEGNLSYRLLLQQHMTVARRIADAGFRRGIADFPFDSILGSHSVFGYIDQPLWMSRLASIRSPHDLCRAEFVVVTQNSVASFPLVASAVAQGLLRLWFVAADDKFPVGKSWYVPERARYDHRIWVYRVTCGSP